MRNRVEWEPSREDDWQPEVGGLIRCGTVHGEYADAWMHVWMLKPDTDPTPFCLPEGGSGPGAVFHFTPVVRKGRHIMVVTQIGGYDV